MAGPLRPNPNPPLELNGRWNFGTLEKKVLKQIFLNGPALYPPPPLNGPSFFAASLRKHSLSPRPPFTALHF